MAVRREIGAGAFFADAEDMVVFLQSTFNENNEEINSLDDFLFRGSVYVIAADNKSTDTVLCLCK